MKRLMKRLMNDPKETRAKNVRKDIPAVPLLPSMDENTIETEYNTLFIEEVPTTFEPIVQDGVPMENIYEKIDGYKKFKLFMGDFSEMGTGTFKILNKLQSGNPLTDSVELHISSYGGSIAELLETYNVLNSMYPEAVTTFLNYGYSAGAMAFLFGTNRIVYENSDFMVHSYAGGSYGKREDMLNHIDHQDKQVTKFLDSQLSPYFTKKEIKKINNGKDYWMNSEEMIKRGIATGIIINGEYKTREDMLDVYDPKRITKRAKKEARTKKASAKVVTEVNEAQNKASKTLKLAKKLNKKAKKTKK